VELKNLSTIKASMLNYWGKFIERPPR